MIDDLLEVMKSAEALGFKILEIKPITEEALHMFHCSPFALHDGDHGWEAPSREHGRIFGIKVIKEDE